MLTEWEEPCSAREAFQRRRILIGEIQEIQVQLGDKVKKLKAVEWDRSRKSREAYYRWHTSAKWALTNRLEELRAIKEWIYENDVYDVKPEKLEEVASA